MLTSCEFSLLHREKLVPEESCQRKTCRLSAKCTRKRQWRAWETNFTCFIFLPKISSAVKPKELSTKPTSYHQNYVRQNCRHSSQRLLSICSRGSNGYGPDSISPHISCFPYGLKEQLMNSWEPNSAHLQYYCIVHHNDSNNLVMSVHSVRPSIKPTAWHPPCLCIVSTEEAFHSPLGPVTFEKVGDHFLSDILASGHEYWELLSSSAIHYLLQKPLMLTVSIVPYNPCDLK